MSIKKDQVLIYSSQLDQHASIIIDRLNNMDLDIEVIRLNTGDIPVETRLSLNEEKGLIYLEANGRIVDTDRVLSCWLRKPDMFALPPEWSRREKEFATKELSACLTDFFLTLNCYWINDPSKLASAKSKIEQLRRAKRFGFSTPRTLLTSDAGQVKSFFADCDEKMIFKVIVDPFLALHEDGKQGLDGWYKIESEESFIVTKTTAITRSEMSSIEDALVVPGIFQELVEKQFDLRVTVIGNQIFAAKIHSQDYSETELDWRAADVNLKFSVAYLPNALARKCINYVKSYGLSFSALDFIITRSGDYIFLESNTNGQFLFKEHMLPELKMADALIQCLINGRDI